MIIHQEPLPPTPPPEALPPWGQGLPPWEVAPEAFVVVMLGLCTAAVIILWPLMRAVARRLEGRGADPALKAELEDLRHRLLDVEGQQVRIAELEERLDFAERLLAQQHEKPRIGDR